LYANCSMCHRPGGTNTTLDLSLSASFCEHVPDIVARMQSTGPDRMPPLASSVVDPDGVGLVAAPFSCR
jgi:hypothetical protein